MRFSPVEKYQLVTKKSQNEIYRILRDSVESQKTYRWIYSGKNAYEGTVKPNLFTIQQIRFGLNSFVPMIRGIIKPDHGKTIIDVELFFEPIVNYFIWLFIISTTIMVISVNGTLKMDLWQVAFSFTPLFGSIGLYIFSFHLYAQGDISRLVRLFSATEVIKL